MEYNEKRQHQRNPVTTTVPVKGGVSQQGVLRDMSVGGAAITFPDTNLPAADLVSVGQYMMLTFNDRAKLPGRVTRVFQDGFAARFDFSSHQIQW